MLSHLIPQRVREERRPRCSVGPLVSSKQSSWVSRQSGGQTDPPDTLRLSPMPAKPFPINRARDSEFKPQLRLSLNWGVSKPRKEC